MKGTLIAAIFGVVFSLFTSVSQASMSEGGGSCSSCQAYPVFSGFCVLWSNEDSAGFHCNTSDPKGTVVYRCSNNPSGHYPGEFDSGCSQVGDYCEAEPVYGDGGGQIPIKWNNMRCENNQCVGCHQMDGTRSLNDIFHN